MLNKLLNHNDYGSYEDLSFLLFDVLDFNEAKPIVDIKNFSRERSISLYFSIDAALDIIYFIGWIDIAGELLQPIRINDVLRYKEDEKKIKRLLIEAIITKLKDINELKNFIRLDSFKYDFSHDGIVLRNHMVPLQFSGLRNLFFELGLFSKHASPTLIQINENYTDYFIREIAFWVNEQFTRDIQTNELTYEQYLQIQDIKNNYGAEAEKFVLEYERSRLIDHPEYEKIKLISNIDVGAGFDIISFDDKNSRNYNRFIEVKSLSENIQFYWSRNEVRVAELKQHQYYLYLVNRDKMKIEDYTPIMIQNPYHTIFQDDGWSKNAETWIIKLLNKQ
jgi:hypothetical protein